MFVHGLLCLWLLGSPTCSKANGTQCALWGGSATASTLLSVLGTSFCNCFFPLLFVFAVYSAAKFSVYLLLNEFVHICILRCNITVPCRGNNFFSRLCFLPTWKPNFFWLYELQRKNLKLHVSALKAHLASITLPAKHCVSHIPYCRYCIPVG